MAQKQALHVRIRRRIQTDPRMAKLVHGGLSGLMGRGLAMVVSAVTLPLNIRYLGRYEYGIWVTISTSIVMLAVLDLGISSTLTNFIAKSHVSGDRDAARGYFSSAFWVTTLIAAGLGGLFAVLWPFFRWPALFGVHDAATGLQVNRCVAIAVGFFLLSMPLSLAGKVLSGYQQVQVANYFAMMNSVLGLCAVLVSISARLSLSGMMLTYCSAMLVGTAILNVWLLFVSRPWIRPRLGSIRRSYTRDLFGEGFLFFILQVVGLVVFNTDNLVITHYLGAGEVTPYSIAWRLMQYASMLQLLMIPALWPAFADAYHRGDLTWVRSTYRRTMRLTMMGVGSLALVFALAGQWIIRVWATQSAVPSRTLLFVMAVWAFVSSITTNQASLLAATQRLRLQAVTATAAASLNLLGSIYLVQRIGPLGVILASLGSYLLFILAPQTWEIGHILRGRYLVAQNA